MAGKPLGDITPVSPLDYEPEDDASSVQSSLSQQVSSQRLASLRLTQHEVAWEVLEERMRPRAVLPRFPAWLGPSSLGGACFQEDFQVLEQNPALGVAMKGPVHRCINISSDSASQPPDHPLEVLIRPLSSHDSRRSVAQQRRILEKLSRAGGAIQLRKAYADTQQAYLVFRPPENGCCLSNLRDQNEQQPDAMALVHAVIKALSEVHAAGVCLLNMSADSIWISQTGSATFLDFSMAHEFVPGEAELVCALPALQLTQQHAAPEVVSASLAHSASCRLTPFNGSKADVWAVGQIMTQVVLPADSHAMARLRQSTLPSGLRKVLLEMVADEPAARPDASQTLQRCRKLC